MKALLLGIVELVAIGWLAGLACSAYLQITAPSSHFPPDMPETAILAPLWGWLLVGAGLASAFAVVVSVMLARRAGSEPGWAVRATVVVLPVAFSAQLVYSGARWSSLSGGVMTVGCALCVAASVAAFILTRQPDLADGQAAQPS